MAISRQTFDSSKYTEITGAPAQSWGSILIPTNGKVSVRIEEDALHAVTKSGLEMREAWLLIQNLDSIEVLETPIYSLLFLGISMTLTGLGIFVGNHGVIISLLIGIALIVFAITQKNRYVAIRSNSYVIPVFMRQPPIVYRQFAANVIETARRLRVAAQPQALPRKAPPPPPFPRSNKVAS